MLKIHEQLCFNVVNEQPASSNVLVAKVEILFVSMFNTSFDIYLIMCKYLH